MLLSTPNAIGAGETRLACRNVSASRPLVCSRQRHRPLTRHTSAVSQAAPQSHDTRLSPDEAQKGLQYQLDRSAQQPTEAEQPRQNLSDYEKDLIRRQRSAREWITPWLTVKARSKSVDTLQALRKKVPGLTQKQQDSALKRLLAQSWQMAAANPTTIWDDDDMNDESEMEISTEE